MTKQPSPPSSKPTSQTGGGKDEAKENAPEPKPMERFRALAKKVVAASPETIRRMETKKDPDRS